MRVFGVGKFVSNIFLIPLTLYKVSKDSEMVMRFLSKEWLKLYGMTLFIINGKIKININRTNSMKLTQNIEESFFPRISQG